MTNANASTPIISNYPFTSEQRPWGSFEILLDAPHVKVKRLIVAPGQRLSLQSHQKREEIWVVVQGTATVTLGDDDFIVDSSDSSSPAIFIPTGAKHRLSNLGNEQLEVIETQRGSYFGEDDIQRYQDDHGRDVQSC